MLHLDGSYGEGGGQIVRTSLSLAALLGREVRLENIRAGRSKPGLKAQHVTGVRALAHITRAEVAGAELHSRALVFKPRAVQAGSYLFDVAEKTGSAGSVSLVAQTLLPPLLRAGGPSSLTIRGGTHVAWSPPAHYLMHVFAPALAEMGADVAISLEKWGWYPRGGGEIRLTIQPARHLQPVDWRTPPAAGSFQGLSAGSRVPEHVVARQARRLKQRLGEGLNVAEIQAPAMDPGSFVFLWGPRAGFSALGARGKPAEKVADEAAQEYDRFRQSRAAVDRHLADQILLYLALADGPSTFVTEEITLHLLTNLWVVEQFLGPRFEMEGELGTPGKITCRAKK
ncbi:MAG: RNA 3'-terminal phosphate cyclase [Deltaproteobacteria bacterium]|nr:RNA 3'-terminal phosphate cyclase [Deltaproteobacteria bacterium]